MGNQIKTAPGQGAVTEFPVVPEVASLKGGLSGVCLKDSTLTEKKTNTWSRRRRHG